VYIEAEEGLGETVPVRESAASSAYDARLQQTWSDRMQTILEVWNRPSLWEQRMEGWFTITFIFPSNLRDIQTGITRHCFLGQHLV
jgi:hypothetical protein